MYIEKTVKYKLTMNTEFQLDGERDKLIFSLERD